ncbi:PilW family protein [Pleionea mediterranea]|uniref:Type IV pilus assembly protein PilW n=1 Tax=Pleionea mediterranea TaxID=523701 RepID=A0A316FT81_9GAMM|nr:PilW family protein [Pleionea mediterranea]PWK50916.1 type IV pilus assembly protein PilW [Pleionea mediterranea]
MRVAFNKNSGFSLVELMIAGILGLILLAGVISLMLGTKQSYRTQDQLGGLQTDGRFALLFIERFVENAGWFEDVAPSIDSAVSFSDIADGGATGNDTLAVQTEVPAGTGIDCNGSSVTGTVVKNIFSLSGDSLMCLGNGGAVAQPIVENVQSFQVLYGLDSDTDGVVNQYVNAAGLSDAKEVISVQVGLLLRSTDNVRNQAEEETFDVLDMSLDTNDLRLRRVFQKTIMIPNQAFLALRSE